jgi:uncharacterized metal-binding protein YceD (DUF177 family)
MNDKLVIQLNGLADGKQYFRLDLGKEFFASFGNSDILDASVAVDVHLEKSGDSIGLDVSLEGTLTVPCDRCLAPVVMEIRDEFDLDLKSGDLEDNEEYDLSQDIYDYSCLALPLRRVHEEGGCDPELVSHIGKSNESVSGNSPFASLGNLLEDLK